jgi:hypothetical protein
MHTNYKLVNLYPKHLSGSLPTHPPVVSTPRPKVKPPLALRLKKTPPRPKPSPQSPLPTLAAGGGATQPTLLRCTLLGARPLILHPARPGAPLPRF